MTSNSKMLLGILGAVAAGVVIGLLTAPEKGSDMRDRISRKANGLSNGLNKMLSKTDGMLSKADRSAEKIKDMV